MKALQHFAILLAGIFIMASCQKEYSFETGSPGGVAVGTLVDSLGDCKPARVVGRYFADSLLTTNNTVTIQVNVSTPGSYTIVTETRNGFYFTDTGYFAAPGINDVTLKANGRPAQAITTDFTITFGTSFCMFSIPVSPASTGGGNTNAAFTLSGTPTNCTNAVVLGTYTAGTALNNVNTVDIQVNVTTAGAYSIVTTPTNGITFSKAGNFTTTGVQTVRLQGTGTPTTAGATQIPITAGTSNCTFPVNVAPAANTNINMLDSAWQFAQGARTFHGTLDSVVFSQIQGVDVLQFYGLTAATGDSLFILGIGTVAGTIQSGTYNTSTFAVFDFSDANDQVIFQANPSTVTPPVNLTVVLTYDPVSKIAEGTFTGTAYNAANASVPITSGKFKARLP